MKYDVYVQCSNHQKDSFKIIIKCVLILQERKIYPKFNNLCIVGVMYFAKYRFFTNIYRIN